MTIAITGGIGSGKSHICRLLEKRGISVYDCDMAAKRLMRTSLSLQRRLSEAVGQDVFPGGRLDKALLSRFIVAAEGNAQRIDDIVHPAVAEDFLQSGYEWIESAILFESRFHLRIHPDTVICVTAPAETRIRRIMQRDNLPREKALDWINRQMTQEDKAALSDYTISNGDGDDADSQIDNLLKALGIP